MSIIDEIRNERADLARVLGKHKGIRRLVEELYPDSAHFIYELLQNAEDVHATVAFFGLNADSLTFVHNGRAFNESDIRGITDIGEGTKAGDEDKIGRFGVGFKAVFAYCESPSICSPTYSFRITDLVLPHEIATCPGLGKLTRFEFPFNNPKKLPADAHREVLTGLQEIAETTLLFLRHLEAITWSVGGQVSEVLRVAHSEHHIEILRRVDGQAETSAHFLRFLEPAIGAATQNIAIAFELEPVMELGEFDRRKSIAKQLRIRPANPGRVAVFFPAEKETSGLRFHLHAPFVPELSRASVKETSANEPLFQQLAGLAAESLHKVRDLKLLTGEVLAVLPNPQDDLPDRYKQIRKAIIDEMNKEPLTPVYGGKAHAPARHLLQARASLKALLSETDLEYLVDAEDTPRRWAIAATQRNSEQDRFLEGLAITTWDLEQFVALLIARAPDGQRFVPTPPYFFTGPDPAFVEWLAAKSIEWHQQLYALLEEHLAGAGWRRDSVVQQLRALRIVRLGTGGYSTGGNCYFPSEGTEHDEVLPRIDRAVYSSGRSKAQQEGARRFLEAIGVREVGEAEQVEAILKRRYSKSPTIGSQNAYHSDLKRFVQLVEKAPSTATLFADAFIFERTSNDWGRPRDVFLDHPYLDTGLAAYFVAVGDGRKRAGLSERYQQCGLAMDAVVRFAELTGVQTRLEIVQTYVSDNPQASYLYSVGGERRTSPTNQDFVIEGLATLLAKPSIPVARLIWRTMCSLPPYPDYLTATYRRSARGGTRHADSQLVHMLRDTAWVPQANGFVRPAEGLRELLPEGFPFDSGQKWLKAVRFGEEALQRSEDQKRRVDVAQEFGFGDWESLERAKEFARLPADEQRRILDEHRDTGGLEEIDDDSAGSERRRSRVREGARDAPDRGSELQLRSVSERRDGVKEGADTYLRQYYSKDRVLYCQIGNHALPFKLPNSDEYYFEAVEILTRKETSKHHKQNYLCLCPNHAAMFRFANPSRERMRPLLNSATRSAIKLSLAGNLLALNFKQKHLDDLKAIMEEDRGPAVDPDSK